MHQRTTYIHHGCDAYLWCSSFIPTYGTSNDSHTKWTIGPHYTFIIYCNTYWAPNDYRHECLISQPKKNTGPHPLLTRCFTTAPRLRLHDTNCIREMLLCTRIMLLFIVVFPIGLLIQTNKNNSLHWMIKTVVHIWMNDVARAARRYSPAGHWVSVSTTVQDASVWSRYW